MLWRQLSPGRSPSTPCQADEVWRSTASEDYEAPPSEEPAAQRWRPLQGLTVNTEMDDNNNNNTRRGGVGTPAESNRMRPTPHSQDLLTLRTISGSSSVVDETASDVRSAFEHRTSVKSRFEMRCECGSVFMPDAHFCRKCGRRRMMRLRSDSWDLSGIIWQWSGTPSRRWCCCRRQRFDEQSHFRFLDRAADFRQSIGRWNVRRLASEKNTSREIRRLYMSDVYHSFMDIENVWIQFLVYCLAYLISFLSFAFAYLAISERCALGIDGSYIRAYYLSVETMVTIGYGVPDPYYNECLEGAVVMTTQSILGYFLNALVIGAVFVRLTRPQSRSATILFSDKAVIQERNGAFYFAFQVVDAKHHDLLEAHVRCYCIRRDRKGSTKYVTLPMRLQHPDDDKGAMMLMTLPQQIVHRIDHWSPLSPSWDSLMEQRKAAAGRRRFSREGRVNSKGEPQIKGELLAPIKENPVSMQPQFWGADCWFDVPQRQADSDQGSRDACVCPTCGDSFQTLELLRRHTEYQAAQDAASDVPRELRHTPWTLEDFQSWGWTLVEESETQEFNINTPCSCSMFIEGKEVALTGASREELETFMSHKAHIEVLVLVEGIEPTTSSTIQARHSYLFPEDLAWDKQFVDCLRPGTSDRPCAVDLSYFHELQPFDENESEGRPMRSEQKKRTGMNLPKSGAAMHADKQQTQQAESPSEIHI